ncbi:MAG: N-methylhydantoinase A [Gammaproteobacteria bacterium]|jgi:N-methylhydantoinase A
MPLFGEYERTSETVLNAYVMPLVGRYLNKLQSELLRIGVSAPLYIMQSSGGMTTPENSMRRPIEIIECGPAAGVVGAAKLARVQATNDLITFDMGGTTAKASIVERGQFSRAAEYEVGGGINRASRLLKGAGYVVRVSSTDVAEIGAGGGSLLKIAGAHPGPVCYNQGGVNATITDADVVLGYINPVHLCGGDYPLAPDQSRAALLRQIAQPMGGDELEAAYGAYQLANAQMMRAIRAVSSERGRDPRAFTLYAFGGAGPVHAAGVAAGLGMRSIIIPPMPGVFSAYGLLAGDLERHYTRSFSRLWTQSAIDDLNTLLAQLLNEAIATMHLWAGSAVQPDGGPSLTRWLDMQYSGQGSSLSIPLRTAQLHLADVADLAGAFEDEHERTYGHRLRGQAIRATALRMSASVAASVDVGSSSFAETPLELATGSRLAYWGPRHGALATPVHDLRHLTHTLQGPALIDCYDTTIVVPPNASIARDAFGGARIALSEGT